MSNDSPDLDDLYGVGAEEADDSVIELTKEQKSWANKLKLTRLQRKILAKFQGHGSYHVMERVLNAAGNYTWTWGGDYLLPTSKGVTVNELLWMGLLAIFDGRVIRITPAGKEYKCRRCTEGKLYDDMGLETGKCPVCEGTGCLLERGHQ